MIAESLDTEIAQWARQGRHDLEMAEKNIGMEGFDTSILLSQQAAEKLLKAAYLKKFKKRASKTHFIDQLGEDLGLPDPLKESARLLAGDYTASRYPDVLGVAPVDAYHEEDARGRLEKAREIVEWCEKTLR